MTHIECPECRRLTSGKCFEHSGPITLTYPSSGTTEPDKHDCERWRTELDAAREALAFNGAHAVKAEAAVEVLTHERDKFIALYTKHLAQNEALTVENARLEAVINAVVDKYNIEKAVNEWVQLSTGGEALTRDLAECYRLTGADPDGNENKVLAKHAVVEVKRLRAEHDQLQDVADARDAALLALEEKWQKEKSAYEAGAKLANEAVRENRASAVTCARFLFDLARLRTGA